MTLLDDYRRAVYSPKSEEQTHHRCKPRKSCPRIRLEALPEGSTAPLSTLHEDNAVGCLNKEESHRETVGQTRSNQVRSPPDQEDRFKRRPVGGEGGSNSSRNHFERKPTVLQRLQELAASTEATSGYRLHTPSELPSQFVHCPHVHINRWTVIVSDITLFRIAALNARISSRKRKCALGSLQLSPGSSTDLINEAEEEPTKSLVMNGASKITDQGIRAIAESVSTLEALEIADAALVTDASLRSLAVQCPLLRRLNISNCSGIHGPGLGAIAEHCIQMTKLELADCSHLGDWVLLRCFYAFTQLESVNFSRCSQMTDYLLQTLAHQCPCLRKVLLIECVQVSDAGVVPLARACRKLERLELNRTTGTERITDTSCATVGECCPLLREINFAGCNNLTDAGLKWIADGCPQLENLDLANIRHLTDASLRALSENCHKLKGIRLANVKNISDVGLRFLATGCPKLERLNVSNLYLVSDGSNRDFGLEGLQAVAMGCPALRDLNMSGCFQVVERAMVSLGSHCRNLQRVNLQACPRVSLNAIISLLHDCPMLQALNLGGHPDCTNTMVKAIAQHGAAITELCLARCDQLGDIGLRGLAKRADQLQHLDVSGCLRLSDVGMNAFIDGMQRPVLAHLMMAGCLLVTQDSIVRLANVCPLLLTLSVHGCRVSPRVLQSIRQSWPFAELRVPSGNAALQSDAELGMFPMPRANDRRYVEETCVFWAAALRIQVGQTQCFSIFGRKLSNVLMVWQNLFRARQARRHARERREDAMRLHVVTRLQSRWRGRKARREALIRRLIQSGIEKAAIKIQRRYREVRAARKARREDVAESQYQTGVYALIVQRRFRAKRAAKVANMIMAAKRKQRKREVEAATLLQRRFRGLAGRKRFNLLMVESQAREREQREASLRIQTLYRGREARKKAKALERDKQLQTQHRERLATKIQGQYRRHMACKEAQRRRDFICFREQCAIRVQTAFRARRGRQTLDLLRLAQHEIDCTRAAIRIQTHWRGRRGRIAHQILLEVRRQREQRQIRAATFLQRTFRRYHLRLQARKIIDGLVRAKQFDEDMAIWAATYVQAHWRRLEALKTVDEMQLAQRTRWKQLVDTYNQHGMGYGAPFFYNQVNSEIRWRMPREVLMLQPRPTCNQCEMVESAVVECATCCEFFCGHCNTVVHGHGKRQAHNTRKLFDFYDKRCEYGDGTFPSIWPSEIEQDHARGYDFVTMLPKDNYQEMLWQIAQFEPVMTGKWEAVEAVPPLEQVGITQAQSGLEQLDSTKEILFLEHDVDDQGNILWEPFFDHTQQQYRYYHRVTKRVVTFVTTDPAISTPPATTDSSTAST